MSADTALAAKLSSGSVQDLVERLARDLDVPSPAIGSRGPAEPGPERPYVRALKELTAQQRSGIGAAINKLLLEEAAKGGESGDVPRPFLMFNLLVLLETVPLPRAQPALGALKHMPDPLKAALTDHDEDVYRQALLALAANQGKPGEVDFWKSLLRLPALEYVAVAEAGLRNAGWEPACEALPLLKSTYTLHPGVGNFELAVMVLIDSYPNANWPHCASDFIGDPLCRADVMATIREYAGGRFEQPLAEVQREPGTAIDDLARRSGEDRLREIEGEQRKRCESAALALL